MSERETLWHQSQRKIKVEVWSGIWGGSYYEDCAKTRYYKKAKGAWT